MHWSFSQNRKDTGTSLYPACVSSLIKLVDDCVWNFSINASLEDLSGWSESTIDVVFGKSMKYNQPFSCFFLVR